MWPIFGCCIQEVLTSQSDTRIISGSGRIFFTLSASPMTIFNFLKLFKRALACFWHLTREVFALTLTKLFRSKQVVLQNGIITNRNFIAPIISLYVLLPHPKYVHMLSPVSYVGTWQQCRDTNMYLEIFAMMCTYVNCYFATRERASLSRINLKFCVKPSIIGTFTNVLWHF